MHVCGPFGSGQWGATCRAIMIRETQGMFVAGDKTAIAYLRHVCSADQAMPALHSLDEKHAFATGSHGAAKLLDEKIEAFVSQNMLEPPEACQSHAPPGTLRIPHLHLPLEGFSTPGRGIQSQQPFVVCSTGVVRCWPFAKGERSINEQCGRYSSRQRGEEKRSSADAVRTLRPTEPWQNIAEKCRCRRIKMGLLRRKVRSGIYLVSTTVGLRFGPYLRSRLYHGQLLPSSCVFSPFFALLQHLLLLCPACALHMQSCWHSISNCPLDLLGLLPFLILVTSLLVACGQELRRQREVMERVKGNTDQLSGHLKDILHYVPHAACKRNMRVGFRRRVVMGAAVDIWRV
eukprot:5289293-Amphidinium_carterae.1